MNTSTHLVSFRKGLKRVMLFYLSGLIATMLFHLIVGWENLYAPPLSTLVAVFLMIIGLLWAILNLSSLPDSQRRPQTLGELTAHMAVFALLFSAFILKVELF